MVLRCIEPFITTLPWSQYDLNNVEREEKTKSSSVCSALSVCLSQFLTLSVPNFRLHLSSALFFSYSTGKKLICKVERLNVKLLDLRCLQKPIIITSGSERVKLNMII